VVGRLTSPRFVGRREELDALRATLDRAADGCGSVILVGGEAGIGKSRLIGKLAAQARRDGATVLIGECLPLGGDGELPYAPVIGALRSLARERGIDELARLAGAGHDELARLLPDLSQTDAAGAGGPSRPPFESEAAARSGGSQARLFEQLLAVFTAVARASTLLIAVEDLHWSDRATRDFLSFLVRAARDEPIVLAVTYRSDEVAGAHPALGFVHELERSGHAVAVTLTAFNRQEIREQVAAIREEDPDPLLVERLVERAEGNPFFTEELLASADEADGPLPESLRQALLLRLATCPADVTAVVRTIAVAGREIEHATLEAVLELPLDRLVPALREAMYRHVLVQPPDTTKYAFRHALLCEAAYSDLLPIERQRVHRALAEVIQRQPELGGTSAAAAAKLSHHWHRANEPRYALHASVEAAIEADLVYAPGEALKHYERALDLWAAVSPANNEVALDRVGLLRRASEAAAMVGESQRAIDLAREVLRQVDRTTPVAAALAHERLGRRLWTAGRGVEALPEHRRAVELMPAQPTAELAQVLAAEAQMLMLCHRSAESESRCHEALALARELGARHVEANVLNTMCAHFSHTGYPERGVAAAAEARAIAKELGLAEELGRSYVNGSDALDHAGRIGESIALAVEGLDECQALGLDRWFGDCLRAEIAGRLLRTGDWDGAAQLLDELFQKMPTGINAGNAYAHRGLLHAQRGDREQTWDAVTRGEEYVACSGGSLWLAPMAEARATIELWDGLPEAAGATVDACLAAVAGGESVLSTARLYELGVRAAVDLALGGVADPPAAEGAGQRADSLLTRLNGLIAALPGPAPLRVRAIRQAAIAERSRTAGSDPAEWEHAACLWGQCGDRYQAAYARWRQAEALLTAGGERRAAQDSARGAHDVAHELQARPLAAAVEALARRGRLELGEPDEEERDELSVALDRLELTRRELEVLALVGEGMTNREIGSELFITDKTASVHVSRILGKLSVSNRAAAAAAAQRLGVERVAALAG
jgi:DNA-binding CsgD family transcriptional regulator